jgi:release factor glutamine methyltransferase
LNNEPHLALFVEDEDALIFYKKNKVSAENLTANGMLFLK